MTQNMIARQRLCLTADKSELVDADDERAAFLYATPGTEIPLAEATSFGLVDGALPGFDADRAEAEAAELAAAQEAAAKEAAAADQAAHEAARAEAEAAELAARAEAEKAAAEDAAKAEAAAKAQSDAKPAAAAETKPKRGKTETKA